MKAALFAVPFSGLFGRALKGEKTMSANSIPEAKHDVQITDDLTDTKVILDELINAHKQSPFQGRERSLIITKLQEARMWTLEAQGKE